MTNLDPRSCSLAVHACFISALSCLQFRALITDRTACTCSLLLFAISHALTHACMHAMQAGMGCAH